MKLDKILKRLENFERISGKINVILEKCVSNYSGGSARRKKEIKKCPNLKKKNENCDHPTSPTHPFWNRGYQNSRYFVPKYY